MVILSLIQDGKLKLKRKIFFHAAIGISIVYQPIINCQCWRLITLLANLMLYESYLDFTVSVDDNSLCLNGYNLTCADHLDNVKRGGVCMHYKENLSLRIISTSYFNQCLLCEVTCQNQKGYNVLIYPSASQSCNEFEDFLFNLEKLINQVKQLKPSFTII